MMDPKELADRSVEAWRLHDVEDFAACYAEDARMTAPGGVHRHGRDGARQFFGVWHEAFPDNEITIERDHVCGSVVVHEAVFSGTHTGNLTTPDGRVIPATGRSVSAPFVEVFDIEGDHIIASRLYFDQIELLTQLGLMPVPETAAAS